MSSYLRQSDISHRRMDKQPPIANRPDRRGEYGSTGSKTCSTRDKFPATLQRRRHRGASDRGAL